MMTHSAKLLDENPLVVLPTLAEAIGLNGSIVLQQIHFCINKKVERQDTQTFREGHYWVYNTFEEWAKVFKFWKLRTIKSIFAKVQKLGLLISKKFGQKNWDQKKWYRIDYEALDRMVTNSATSALSTVQHLPDQSGNICTIDCATSAPLSEQDLPDHLKDQRFLTKTSYQEKEHTPAKAQTENTNTETYYLKVEATPSTSPRTYSNSINSAKPNSSEKSSAAPVLPLKNSTQQIEDPFYPKATPWQPTSSPNTIDQGFAEFVFQKVVQKADYWRDKHPTIADAKQYILKARYREERYDQCWLRWLEYQDLLKRQPQSQKPLKSPIPEYLQGPPPDMSWLREQIEQAKQEGHPYAHPATTRL